MSEFPWLEIVGECGNIVTAAAKIEALTPALLFLDIQMPGGSGFDLLTRLEHLPQVIFTTAHDEHAVRAFEVNALDYLLKPIDPARLSAALARVRNENAVPTVAPPPDAPLQQLFLRDGPQCWFVPLREVRLLTSEGNYVRLSWGTRQPLLGRPLSALERRLDPGRFFRANRSQIINLDCIETVESGSTGGFTCNSAEAPKWRFRGARRACSGRR